MSKICQAFLVSNSIVLPIIIHSYIQYSKAVHPNNKIYQSSHLLSKLGHFTLINAVTQLSHKYRIDRMRFEFLFVWKK